MFIPLTYGLLFNDRLYYISSPLAKIGLEAIVGGQSYSRHLEPDCGIMVKILSGEATFQQG